jgi:hypothetical protein
MKRPAIQAALIMALLSCSQVMAPVWANPSSTPSPGLMTRIRQFLGVQPRSVSVGGTRSNAAQAVCLLSPGPIESGRDGPTVRVVDPQPALVLGSPLNEIELRRGETVLWSKLASSKKAISGRLAWPLAPLKPGERLELAMRPRGAAGGDWAVVRLEAASAEEQQRYATELQVSSSDDQQRLQKMDQAAATGDGALAQALLWAPLTPGSSALAALQREQQANCKTISSAR